MSLGLLGAYNSSSSSSSSSGSDEELDKNIDEKEEPKEKLKNPFLSSAVNNLRPSYMVEAEDLGKNKGKAVAGEDSVFSNPFRVKEERKKAMLERHVEMTSKQEELRTIQGKKGVLEFSKRTLQVRPQMYLCPRFGRGTSKQCRQARRYQRNEAIVVK